ncbi:MAG TPA: hypothetical protein DCR93_04105 [Cytophagales bacterium]|nr:hypothetical protein [Cytophagales bacterium]HAP58713.1 hypothetical protein [Cytophagales bacterium]
MKKPRKELKAYFERGDTPTAEQFSELIDSGINLADDGLTTTSDKRLGVSCQTPQSQLSVGGNLTVGKELCNTVAAPPNGLLVQGPVSTEEAIRLKVQRNTPSVRSSEGQLYVKEHDYYHLRLNGKAYVDLTGEQDKLQHLSIGTISLWYRPLNEAAPKSQMLLYLRNGSDTDACKLQLGIGPWTSTYEDECLNFAIRAKGEWYGAYIRKGYDYFTRPRWHHIVVVVDNLGLRIYLDGVEQTYTLQGNRSPAKGFFSALWESPLPPDRFYLGARNQGSGFDIPAYGNLDELAILNMPLQADEVAKLFQAGRETDLRNQFDTELEAYWPLGDAGQFPYLSDLGQKTLTGKYIGDVDPHPIIKSTRQSLMFQDVEGREIPITQQQGSSQAGQLWGQKGENLYFSEGKVGIGTADPEKALDVVGDARMQAYEGARRVWLATGNGPIEIVHIGRIPSRSLSFYKHDHQSILLITYTDNFRVDGNSHIAGRWTIKIDGFDIQPTPINFDWYFFNNQYSDVNMPGTCKGVAYNIAQGEHEISIWVGDRPGVGNNNANSRATGMNNSTWYIEVEEIFVNQLSSS